MNQNKVYQFYHQLSSRLTRTSTSYEIGVQTCLGRGRRETKGIHLFSLCQQLRLPLSILTFSRHYHLNGNQIPRIVPDYPCESKIFDACQCSPAEFFRSSCLCQNCTRRSLIRGQQPSVASNITRGVPKRIRHVQCFLRLRSLHYRLSLAALTRSLVKLRTTV